METEKVCVNLSAVEVGSLDVLVAQGLYTNRSDAIRAGIRAVAAEHEPVISHATSLAGGGIGIMTLNARHLQKRLDEGKRIKLFVVGILRLDTSITPDLADRAIEQIRIFGALKAPQPVLDRIGDRVLRGLDVTPESVA